MNVTIEGIYLNGYAKPDYKDKKKKRAVKGLYSNGVF